MSSAVVPEFPWLLPGALTRATPVARRTTRDWLVDGLASLLALCWVLLAFGDSVGPTPEFALNAGPSWLNEVDLVVGVLSTAALWLRRRWPVALAVVSLPLAVFSVTAAVALLIILFTVAVHRPFPVAAALVGAHLLVTPVYNSLRPDPALPFWAATVWTASFLGGVLAWGMFVRARRQLVTSLRERAHRAETEQQLRVAQARQLERTRIAREMHDVLAHRISLLSLHAGALEFRPDAPPEEVARAAGVIRASAHAALQDLREVIGVLRAEVGGAETPERPQPTLADVPALIGECRAAGVRVSTEDLVVEPATVPAAVGRSAYRIVQEGLTNARKHAPGAVVRVRLGRPAGRRADRGDPQPVAGGGAARAGHPGGRHRPGGHRRAGHPGRWPAGTRAGPGGRLPARRLAAVAGVTGEGAPIRVLIVDDDALVRAGLSMILGGVPDVRVVGEATDGAEVPAAVEAYAPDVVLMDIRMPRVDGLAATEALRALPRPPEVLVLTTFDADDQVLRALRAGAGGFLLKDTPPAEIVQAVRRVAAGEATLSPTVTRKLISHVTAGGPAGPDPRRERALRLLDGLTGREREVAVALGRGRTNAEISAELFMSVATVKAYVSRLLTKLELNNRVQVALLVHDAGLA
ncbi:response regulator [Micromonospora sp. 4G55]|nr:response regulator [Micromonospora sp. 4G55]